MSCGCALAVAIGIAPPLATVIAYTCVEPTSSEGSPLLTCWLRDESTHRPSLEVPVGYTLACPCSTVRLNCDYVFCADMVGTFSFLNPMAVRCIAASSVQPRVTR